MTTTTQPATEKQISYLRSLMEMNPDYMVGGQLSAKASEALRRFCADKSKCSQAIDAMKRAGFGRTSKPRGFREATRKSGWVCGSREDHEDMCGDRRCGHWGR